MRRVDSGRREPGPQPVADVHHRPRCDHRQHQLGSGCRQDPQYPAQVGTQATAADQNQPLAVVAMLIDELHGHTATKRLTPIAERFAGAGHTLCGVRLPALRRIRGVPSRAAAHPRRSDDYRSALKFARQLPETTRTVVWGCSFAGLHATWHAVNDARLAAVIAICPLVDGAHATLSKPVTLSVRLMAHALADLLGSLIGRDPRYVPVSVLQSGFGVLPARDSIEGRAILAVRCDRSQRGLAVF